ncbi:MAG: metalloregulator ArsR/SmtB family transcription factor [Terracidiphilus sp.]|jgi:DNA-binding transcriptional ArsR family regulator
MGKKKVDVDRVFHALGDATRRAMLERLSPGSMSTPMSVSRLAEPFNMSLAAVVQHLQVLEEAGLVKTEKTGRVRSCRVDAAGLYAAEEWLRARRPEWDRRLGRLGELMAEHDDKSGKSGSGRGNVP